MALVILIELLGWSNFISKILSKLNIKPLFVFTDYTYYECNQPLLTNAKLTATSSLRERGPDKAQLNSKYCEMHQNNGFQTETFI